EAISWRAAFVFQAIVVLVILVLGRRIHDPLPADPSTPVDRVGAVLSGAGMFLVVLGILLADDDAGLMVAFLVAGAALIAAFVLHIRRCERRGRTPLLSTAVFRDRVA